MVRVIALAIFLSACAAPTGEVVSASAPTDAVMAIVSSVEDGDSMTVRLAGSDTRVRLIGINAPERDECWGAEAWDDLARFQGSTIGITYDVEERDQYGRVLAYIWDGDALINAELVANGSAFATAFPPNTAYQDVLDAAEELGQDEGRGLWGRDACGETVDAAVEIGSINADPDGPDEQHLEDEFVTVVNRGETAADLTDWILRDSSTVHRFTFPTGFILNGGDEVAIASGCGDDTDRILFWCADGPVWNNSGDEATLMTPNGTIIDHVEYGEGTED